MSTKLSKKQFTELLRILIRKEIEEVSTTVTAGGGYDIPGAFTSGSFKAETIEESIRDINKAKKSVQQIITTENRLRRYMYNLVDILQADVPNHSLMKKVTQSYKQNVTKFMRDLVQIVKRMK